MVYYRTYRPQKIGDLDSAQLRESLHAVLSGNRVPHAFLFTGPKGLGKTSTARIVSKVINCENVTNGEPDNTCEQCLSITNGSNIDVLEIDGASNRGIDEIRELRERVNLAPSKAKKKVYIIDEVHMLTTEAFNALLKTIEEPPSHVIFIFCTTEPQKVPATILSRCFRINFQLASEAEIIHSLQRIVRAEKLNINDAALESIAKMAEGGFRDAAKILEEVVALSSGNPITKELVEEKFHMVNITQYSSELLMLLSQRDSKKSLLLIKKIVEEGVNITYFLENLLKNFHILLLSKAGITSEITSKFGQSFSIHDISKLVSLFSEAYTQTKYAVIPQLPTELAVIVWCNEEEVTSVDKPNSVVSTSQKTTINSLLKKQQTLKIKTMLEGDKAKDKVVNTNNLVAEQGDISKHVNDLTTLFENIIYKVKPLNHSIAGVLRGSKIKEVSESTIIFETSYKFHKERLEEQKTCEIIEKAIREVTGKPLKVSVIIKQ